MRIKNIINNFTIRVLLSASLSSIMCLLVLNFQEENRSQSFMVISTVNVLLATIMQIFFIRAEGFIKRTGFTIFIANTIVIIFWVFFLIML